MKKKPDPGSTLIGRDEDIVSVSIRCVDRYAAMLLYDKLCNEAKNGGFRLEVEAEEFRDESDGFDRVDVPNG
jgi:hypothetical protein